MAIMLGMEPHYPVVVGDALMIRVLHDFDEMPTLCVTTEQAMRLWDLDRRTCDKLFDTLIDARLIETDTAGRYTLPKRVVER